MSGEAISMATSSDMAENDCCTLESNEGSSSEESVREIETDSRAGNTRRHSPAQLATPNVYFKFGMVGVGKNYLALITAAARDSSLSEKKIKVNLSFLGQQTSTNFFCPLFL